MAKIPDEYKEWFSNLWHSDADEYKFFDLAQEINPIMTFYAFDHGWQFTTVLDDDFNVAQAEFMAIINRTY